MRTINPTLRFAAIFLLLAHAPFVAADNNGAYDDLGPGLFAVFELEFTGEEGEDAVGELVCELFFDQTPMTVANFAGLAEGSRRWIDPATGEVRADAPFYDGVIFHRVVEGFVIQSGDPLGTGGGGPGYNFPDEIRSELRHSEAGILSMANAGRNTNGSQFFITLDATPHLDGDHTVFGRVVRGMEVVEAIGATQTGSDLENGDDSPDIPPDRPVDDIVIQSVSIVRNGPDAEAFDPGIFDFAEAMGLRTEISRTGSLFSLHFEQEQFNDYPVFASLDLETWVNLQGFLPRILPIEETADSVDIPQNITSGLPKVFFRVARVWYPSTAFTLLNSRTFEFKLENFNPPQITRVTLPEDPITNTAVFDGTYVDNPGTSYELTGRVEAEITGDPERNPPENRPYLNRMVLLFDSNSPLPTPWVLFLDYVDESSGTFTGTALTDHPRQLHGTFTVAHDPPPPDEEEEDEDDNGD